MRIRALFAVVSFMLLFAGRTAAQNPPVCEPLRYFNPGATEYIFTSSMPTPWWGVRMSVDYIANVDTAYIGFGVERGASSGITPDTLDIRILRDKLPQQIIEDNLTLLIPPNVHGKVPDAYYLAEFQISSPVAQIAANSDFWLSWRIRGPAGDKARIRLKGPALNPRRSIVIHPNGDTTIVTNFVKSQLGLGRFDSVDLMAEARVCYPFFPPVELQSFTATYRDGASLLIWHTATEQNNMGFEILRQVPVADGSDVVLWQRIGFVEGHGTTTAATAYSYRDVEPSSGMQADGIVRYRLRQLDYDGGSELSPVAEVRIPITVGFSMEQNYPNPARLATASTTISFHLPKDADILLELHDMLGRVVKTVSEGRFAAGRHYVDLPLQGLCPGTYMYRLTAGGRVLARRMSVVQ